MSTLSRVAGTALLALMFALAVAGVAWGTTTIRCPHNPNGWSSPHGQPYCQGTNGNDYIIGSDRADYISPGKVTP